MRKHRKKRLALMKRQFDYYAGTMVSITAFGEFMLRLLEPGKLHTASYDDSELVSEPDDGHGK